MMKYFILSTCLLFTVLYSEINHKKTPSFSIATFTPYVPKSDSNQLYLPEDLEATLWAESPQFFNPTNIDTDVRGRIWVTEAVNYRDFNNKPAEHLHHPEGDRVMILEDTDGDGKCDQSKVFVQDKDLVSPLGIAVIGNKVIVSCAPSVIIYTDTNGDDKPDTKEIFLTGFGGLDHDHSLHSFVAGPDGNWYFNTGNAGPHIVKDHSGWTLRSGSLYTGGTPYNLKNEGNMASDDGRIWVGGLALRVGSDGKGLKVLAHNFRNAYELAVDSYGNLWQNDNDDQVVTCRTTWLMEGGNAGYFSADGTRYWQADKRPGQETFTAHWHQEDPGVIPAGDNTGAGSPTGVVVYESDVLGPQYRGMLLSADAGRNVIFAYKPEVKGAGYQLNRVDLITSLQESTEDYKWNEKVTDKRKLFRPSDVAVGTDGAIYIADWYDPIVGGHLMHDKGGYGRIYRITPKGKKLPTPAINLNTTKGQIEALLNPAINVRNLGFEKLKAKGPKAVKQVKNILSSDNPYHQARAVWLLSQLGPKGTKEVENLLDHPNPEIRITAFRALRQQKENILPYADKMVNDSSPAVRRELAVALRDVPFDKIENIITNLVQQYDGTDRWYLESLGIALEGKEETIYPKLVAALNNEPAQWDQKVADLVWRLHPKAAVDALKMRANSASLSPEERKKAIAALGFIKDKSAAQAMIGLSSSNLPDVAEQALWWLKYRKSNDWLTLINWGDSLSEEALETRQQMLQLQKDILDNTLPVNSRIENALQMATDATGGQLLISLASEKKLPQEIAHAVSTHIFTNPNQTVRVLASDYFQRPGSKKLLSINQVTRLQPQAEKGKKVFLSNCATCHKHGDKGGDIGPDLSQIHKKFDKVGLLDAIINPSAGMAFGYEPWRIKTKNGATYYGFLRADGPTVVIREASGQQQVIQASQIESRTQLTTSLMPDPTVLGLKEQDLADLVEFMLARPQE